MLGLQLNKGRSGTYKGIGNVGCCVEHGQSASELRTAVKSGQVVDNQWEEARLGHAEEESQCKQAAEVVRRGRQESHGPKGEHEDGQNARRAKMLAENGDRGSEDDVGDEEDGEQEVVLVILEVEI